VDVTEKIKNQPTTKLNTVEGKDEIESCPGFNDLFENIENETMKFYRKNN
jgi:hypothetical protein